MPTTSTGSNCLRVSTLRLDYVSYMCGNFAQKSRLHCIHKSRWLYYHNSPPVGWAMILRPISLDQKLPFG